MGEVNPYIGHESQLYGVEEHRLVGGKGDGMRLYEVTNGLGLELAIAPDRCLDIPRLRYRGRNMSYFSPCGYVGPAFYQATESNWLKSFFAGFLTTCGLESVGVPCVDNGESLPLHGTIANTPADHSYFCEEDGDLVIRGVMKDEVIFARKMRLNREIRVSTKKNEFQIIDTIENTGDTKQPFEILYHMNMGYPLLDEDSVIRVYADEVVARDDHAQEDIANWNKAIKPQAGYQERCYYHKFHDGKGRASIFQPKLGQGLEITFDASKLDGFVEWKMMGVRDYVMGLECGNCYPDGRDAMRKSGMLKFLAPGEKITYQVNVRMLDQQE